MDNDRLKHSISVGRKMIEIGKKLNLSNNELKELYLSILNKADMQIDKYGNDVGYDKRLEDIKSRYGSDSMVYKKAEQLIQNLREE